MGTEVIGVSRRPDRSGGLSVTNSANNDNILWAIVIELAHGWRKQNTPLSIESREMSL